MPGFDIIEIPHPLGGLSKELIEARAQEIVDNLIPMLTRGVAEKTPTEADGLRAEGSIIKIRARSNTQAIRAVNALFYEKHWGLPPE
jgi:hypothetical protein